MFRKLAAVALLFITFATMAGGCSRQRSTPENAIPVSDQPLITLIGKRITIRGRFSLPGKIAPYIVLNNQQEVYIVNRSEWGSPYSEMQGKLVEATGTLRFYREPPADPRTTSRSPRV